ncbi:MAG: hypothetical protein IT372_34265 [Polyangiaceae bacterium]|nr:hypothetical protein [Polyangiaceae bacterium]
MIVVFLDELFAPDASDDVRLVALLAGAYGRYKIELSPAYRPSRETAFHRWVEQQSAQIRARILVALEEGHKAPRYARAGGGREPTIIVEDRGEPLWPDTFEHGPARVPLAVAQDLLSRPLRLLLENDLNDWAFLEKVVPEAWKKRWSRAVEKRWIEPEHGGGIEGVRSKVEHVADDPARRLRTWAMFDSDGRRRKDASPQAEDTRKACEEWGVAHCRLERRAIENYIPRDTLYDWALRRRPAASRDAKLACVRAFYAMERDEHRHFFNMKDGFAGDEGSGQGVCSIYSDPSVDRVALRTGFHRSIAQHVWSDSERDGGGRPRVYAISEQAFVNDGFDVERNDIFQSIFSRL